MPAYRPWLMGLLVFLLAVSPGLPAAPGPTVQPVQSWQQLTVQTGERIDFDLKGFSLSATRGYLDAGRHPAAFVMSDRGQRWLLVPYTQINYGQAEFRSEVPDLHGASYLAVSPTGEFYPQVVNLKLDPRDRRTVKQLILGRPVRTAQPVRLRVDGYWTPEEREAALSAMARADTERAQRERDQVRKIGARICRREGRTQYVGFTEAVSPDVDKIQVRVTQAQVGDRADLQPTNFTPGLTWDTPAHWHPCE